MPPTSAPKKCCDDNLLFAEPRDKSLGKRTESWICPTCRAAHVVEFQCVEIGDEVDCQALRIVPRIADADA